MPFVATQAIYVNCTDLDRSIAFYEKIGFRLLRRVETPGNWSVLRVIAMPPDALAEIAIMRLRAGQKGSCHVNLVQWKNPPTHGKPTHLGPHSDLAHVGFARLSIRTTNVLAEYERLVTEGVKFLSTPEAMPGENNVEGGYVVCAIDPDGAIIPLLQLEPAGTLDSSAPA